MELSTLPIIEYKKPSFRPNNIPDKAIKGVEGKNMMVIVNIIKKTSGAHISKPLTMLFISLSSIWSPHM